MAFTLIERGRQEPRGGGSALVSVVGVAEEEGPASAVGYLVAVRLHDGVRLFQPVDSGDGGAAVVQHVDAGERRVILRAQRGVFFRGLDNLKFNRIRNNCCEKKLKFYFADVHC